MDISNTTASQSKRLQAQRPQPSPYNHLSNGITDLSPSGPYDQLEAQTMSKGSSTAPDGELGLDAPATAIQSSSTGDGRLTPYRGALETANGLNRNRKDSTAPHAQLSAAEHLAALLPRSHVVKAFNSLSAFDLAGQVRCGVLAWLCVMCVRLMVSCVSGVPSCSQFLNSAVLSVEMPLKCPRPAAHPAGRPQPNQHRSLPHSSGCGSLSVRVSRLAQDLFNWSGGQPPITSSCALCACAVTCAHFICMYGTHACEPFYMRHPGEPWRAAAR